MPLAWFTRYVLDFFFPCIFLVSTAAVVQKSTFISFTVRIIPFFGDDTNYWYSYYSTVLLLC